MNFLGARTSLCFIQFLSKLCALQTFLLLTSILIRALLEPIQQLLRIQLSQASACSLNNSKESYPLHQMLAMISTSLFIRESDAERALYYGKLFK